MDANPDRREVPPGSTIGRAAQITLAIAGFLAWQLRRRLGFARDTTPARRFARLLEDLGTSFVKLGQHLSLRSDIFSADYLAELEKLQDQVRPFPPEVAVAAIERALGRPPAALFVRFDEQPLAAASVAQVHSARTYDGREVVVKVLRPGVVLQVERDMRILAAVVAVLARLLPFLARLRAPAVVREVAGALRRELDLREEARHARRFAEAFRGRAGLWVPDVIPELCTATVMVQERSFGHRVGEGDRPHGARIAQHLIDAYLEMFFALGVFHGDPHPGNVFVLDDGRLALHDFGIVGTLDRPTRHALAAFLLAFTEQDTEWMLDSWLQLGMLSRTAQRDRLREAVAGLLAEYSHRPLREWSVGEAFARLVSATRGQDFDVPLRLLVLVRTLVLLESVVRTLDPDFSLLDSLARRSREAMAAALGAEGQETRRLQFEAAVASVEWQRLLAGGLRRFREEGARLRVDHEGLAELSTHLIRGASRVALALVTLGLYLAGSLLMQFRSGPTVADIPVLALAFHVAAVAFTWRLVRRIGRDI